MPSKEEIDYNRPAAYDPSGRPLYYRPDESATASTAEETALPPEAPLPTITPSTVADDKNKSADISDEVKLKHANSVLAYPDLDLADDEYVVVDVVRVRIGVIFIWTVTFLAVVALTMLAMFVLSMGQFAEEANNRVIVMCTLIVLSSLAIGFGYVTAWVYRRHYLIVSNQRVFERYQMSLFSQRTQAIELKQIGDVSYAQEGIVSHLFHYGEVRLITIGNDHTYRMFFAADPEGKIKTIKSLVHNVGTKPPAESN